ncbi:MAG TPA: dipeptidase PepE [Lutibacter sp.]|nr:dipeptidase PepE [Lutibacter sp.]
MRKLILASTSTVHGKPYLSYLFDTLKIHFKGVSEIVFIPYARPSGLTHDAYTEVARKAFAQIDIKVKGLHEFDDPIQAINEAKGIFTGGGNSFVLLNDLYKIKVLPELKKVILNGTPYFGTSAGSNIAGVNIMNTNDMPIVYPPSFDALGMIPININPHFLDPDPTSKHMGETRETRINEYQFYNKIPVIGIREGSWLEVNGTEIILRGDLKARWFVTGEKTIEVATNSKLNNTSKSWN